MQRLEDENGRETLRWTILLDLQLCMHQCKLSGGGGTYFPLQTLPVEADILSSKLKA